MAGAGSDATRLLVVPNDLIEQELGGETFLDRASLDVKTSNSPDDAVMTVRVWQPSLVVLRSRIGSTSIARLCQTLKAQTPAPRLLMITDHLDDPLGDAQDAICDAHLVSPVSEEQLLETIAEMVGVDQRRSLRAPIDVLVHMDGFAGDGVGSFLANGVNLSEDGMRIEANCQLSIDTRGTLQFFLPGDSERVTLEGRVRLALDEVQLLYAVEFLDLAPQHRARIRSYVERRVSAA